MKIEQLIEDLKKLKEKHGNVDVVIPENQEYPISDGSGEESYVPIDDNVVVLKNLYAYNKRTLFLSEGSKVIDTPPEKVACLSFFI